MFLVLPACSNSNVLSTLSFFKTIINLIMYVVPTILIIVLGFKLFKIVTSSDPDLKSGMGELIGKIIICVSIYFVPLLVSLLTTILAENGIGVAKDYSYCLDSATSENIAFYKEKEEAAVLLEQEKAKAEKEKADEERKAVEETREKARQENEKRAEEKRRAAEAASEHEVIEGTAMRLGDVVWDPNDLTIKSNLTSTQLVGILNACGGRYTNFVPFAADFVTAENKHNINVFFLVALNGLESGWYTGTIAKSCNNLGSVCEHAGHPSNGCGKNSNCAFAYFNSVYESIDYTSGMLERNYLTPGGTYYEGKDLENVYTKHYCPGCMDAGKSILSIGNTLFSHVKDVLNP